MQIRANQIRASTSIYVAACLIFCYMIPIVALPRSIPIYATALLTILLLAIHNGFRISLLVALYVGFGSIAATLTGQINFALTGLVIASFLAINDLNPKFEKKNTLISTGVIVTSISLCIQLIAFHILSSDSAGRSGLGTDPNFSGLIVFLFFATTFRVNAVAAMAPVLIALGTTQSRLLLILVILFTLLLVTSQWKITTTLLKTFKRFPVIATLLLSTTTVLASIYAVSNIAFEGTAEGGLFTRLANLTDKSNYGRFAANVFWLNELIFGNYWIAGTNIEDPNSASIDFDVLPHNSALYAAITSSISYLLFSLVCIKTLTGRCRTGPGVALVISYVAAAQFIHGLYSPIFVYYLTSAVLLINLSSSGNQNEDLNCHSNQKQHCRPKEDINIYNRTEKL